jgi:transposase
MGDLEDCFQIDKEARTSFIEKSILGKLSSAERVALENRIKGIVTNYVGQDLNALSVLAYAAERGRITEFIEKLEKHYEDSLRYVHPEARKLAAVPGAVRAEKFFVDCYKGLGIKPQT